MSLSQVIVCKSVSDVNDPVLDLVEKTYNDSFPEAERRDFALVRELVRSNPLFTVYVLTRDEMYVGFITAWMFDGFAYVEHFAVETVARNGGIGAEALRLFLAFVATPVVLEVEMPVDEMSKRRIGFYERQGFVLDTHVYVQPPYRPGGDSLEMRLMTQGTLDLNQSFERVRDCLYKHVYGVK